MFPSRELPRFDNRNRCEGETSKSSNSVLEPTPPSLKVETPLKNLYREQKADAEGMESKSVVFSSWTKMLDLIELVLKQHNFRVQRIDGRSSLAGRREALRQFNARHGFTVMLASIGSCGEGVDFTAANSVHIMEPHWSPMAETQAVDQVHKKEQTRLVTVTRYIVPESIETYIQWIQQHKLALITQSMNIAEEGKMETSAAKGGRSFRPAYGDRTDMVRRVESTTAVLQHLLRRQSGGNAFQRQREELRTR